MPHELHRLSLQTLLRIDAFTCVILGSLLLLASEPVAALTRIPVPLLFWAGLALFPVAAFMLILSRMAHVQAWGALVVIAGNWLWVLASLLLPLLGFILPNAMGWLFLLAQAAAVAGFAGLEQRAMSKPSPAHA